ncbi:hypothetical protein HOF56_03315, partial [Candidatus Peribacteria bacterium]|nr:hypothetical protein [Candidatus Peribacteria bacterium]
MKHLTEDFGTYSTLVDQKNPEVEKLVDPLDAEEAALVDKAFDSDIAETAAFGSEEIPKHSERKRIISLTSSKKRKS